MNDLALDLYSGIVVTVADVLQQMGHFGKRVPLPVTGQVLFPAGRCWFVYPVESARPKATGYKEKIGFPEAGGSA
jgi:hypothetical protein